MNLEPPLIWLARHRRAAGALALGYLVFVTLGHDLMQWPAYWAQRRLGPRRWEIVVAGCALPVLVVISAWLGRRLLRHPARARAAVYLTVTIGLTLASFRTLLQVNIEIVHFAQYGLFAMLLFPLTRCHTDTMILATVGSIIDEGYQYFVLRSHWAIYFDFNDVILNSVGAGAGLVAVFILVPSLAVHAGPPRPPRWRRPGGVVIGGVALLLVAGALCALGVIRIAPSQDPSSRSIVLRRCGPPTKFWHVTESGKRYHDVRPVSGMIAVIALVIFYGSLDVERRLARFEKPGPSHEPGAL